MYCVFLCVPNDQVFDESVQLSVNGIAVDDAINPSMVQIWIKQCKMDPFRRGINLLILLERQVRPSVSYSRLPMRSWHVGWSTVSL